MNEAYCPWPHESSPYTWSCQKVVPKSASTYHRSLIHSTEAISPFLWKYFKGRSKVMVLPSILLIRADSNRPTSSMPTPNSVLTWNREASLTLTLVAPFAASASMIVFIGTGIPLPGCSFFKIVKGLSDIS